MIAKKIPKPSDTDFVHGIRVERPKVYSPVNPADLMPVPNSMRPSTMRSVERSLWSKVLSFFGRKSAVDDLLAKKGRLGIDELVKLPPAPRAAVRDSAASSPRAASTDAGMRVGDVPGLREVFEQVDRAKPQPVARAVAPATPMDPTDAEFGVYRPADLMPASASQQAERSDPSRWGGGYGVEREGRSDRRMAFQRGVDGQLVEIPLERALRSREPRPARAEPPVGRFWTRPNRKPWNASVGIGPEFTGRWNWRPRRSRSRSRIAVLPPACEVTDGRG